MPVSSSLYSRRRAILHRISATIVLVLAAIHAPPAANALECGDFKFPKCSAPDAQYMGKFDPKVGYGGFGGGQCTATRTPVVFIHGNADRAISWASRVDGAAAGSPAPARSVYDEFKQRGYNDCEMFGITYLDKIEQDNPAGNYHRPDKYKIIAAFIDAVKAYTGKDKVDLVTHSLGATMSLAALTHHDAWGSVRRFVNIAGGIRGLNSCLAVGPMSPAVPTCGSESFIETDVFGFYPASLFVPNSWTGASDRHSLRLAPKNRPEVMFYTLHAGQNDEVHCTSQQGWDDCAKGALFEPAPNVRAQLNLGTGSAASKMDWDYKDGSPWNRMGGDTDGIGHYKARNNAGQVLHTMLSSDCAGLACKGDYAGPVVVSDE
jgi:pimeloyl-ACP methyl ester carboxylesterase